MPVQQARKRLEETLEEFQQWKTEVRAESGRGRGVGGHTKFVIPKKPPPSKLNELMGFGK